MIEAVGLTKWFFRSTVNEVLALDEISFECPEGQWISIVGSNGAGKSTLLKCVAGLVQPDRGRVALNGVTCTRWPDWKRARLIGRIDQDPMASTAPSMTIAENLAIALKRGEKRGFRWGVTGKRRTVFRSALAEIGIGLEERLDALVLNLSGGQRQALALVMATIAGTKVLLLDEHVAALDPKASAQVLRLTERIIRTHGLSTLMVTHNMEHAIRYGDRLLMMHMGRIILDVVGEEKSSLTVESLVRRFHEASGDRFTDDRALLA